MLQQFFGVEPYTGEVIVIGPLSWDYVAISYFQVQAENTQADYQVHKTDIGTVRLACSKLRFTFMVFGLSQFSRY